MGNVPAMDIQMDSDMSVKESVLFVIVLAAASVIMTNLPVMP